MVLGSTGSGLKLRSFSSFVPWKSPQSTSSFLPAASTRYFDPVTHPAAPRNVSFAIILPFYRFCGVRPSADAAKNLKVEWKWPPPAYCCRDNETKDLQIGTFVSR